LQLDLKRRTLRAEPLSEYDIRSPVVDTAIQPKLDAIQNRGVGRI